MAFQMEPPMIQIKSNDYHDFVFRDGKLVGEFEQMYQKSREVPWHQDKDIDRIDCRVALELLATRGPYGRIIEIGCGLGYLADMISQKLGTNNVLGADISATAVSKAGELFPRLEFKVLDITCPLNLSDSFDLTVLRGCFWYLFPQIEQVIENIVKLTKPNGHVMIAQNFPPLTSDFIGKETIPSPDSLLERFKPYYDTVMDIRLDDRQVKGGNDFWLIFLGRKKAL